MYLFKKVRTCDMTIVLITLSATYSTKFHQMDKYRKDVQKRSIPESYQVKSI